MSCMYARYFACSFIMIYLYFLFHFIRCENFVLEIILQLLEIALTWQMYTMTETQIFEIKGKLPSNQCWHT